jgi:hypothetical protein
MFDYDGDYYNIYWLKLVCEHLPFLQLIWAKMHNSIAYIFSLPVTKILSVGTRLLIIVDYNTPDDYESWLLLLFCLIY